MGKLSKYEQSRRDGFEYFVKLYHSQPVRIQEIDEEIESRQLTGRPVGIDRQTENAFFRQVREKVLETVLTLSAWILYDKFDYTEEQLSAFKAAFNDDTSCLLDDYLSFSDIKDTLESEIGFKTKTEFFDIPKK